MKNKSGKIAYLGLCTALALILAYAEILLPPLYAAVPGIKLGLPNVVIIFVLYRFGIKEAAGVSFLRIALVSILFGNAMAFAYSVAGAVLSLTVMAVLRKTNLFSPVGVSTAGAVLHNAGQILMAAILLGTAEIGYYMIVLAATGTVSGILVGICGALAVNRIPHLHI